MNTANVCDDAIVQEVTIKASAEEIFNALTNPAELLKWWGAEGKFQCVHAESDLRPGGKWRMRVSGSCGTGVFQYRERRVSNGSTSAPFDLHLAS